MLHTCSVVVATIVYWLSGGDGRRSETIQTSDLTRPNDDAYVICSCWPITSTKHNGKSPACHTNFVYKSSTLTLNPVFCLHAFSFPKSLRTYIPSLISKWRFVFPSFPSSCLNLYVDPEQSLSKHKVWTSSVGLKKIPSRIGSHLEQIKMSIATQAAPNFEEAASVAAEFIAS